MMRFFFQAEDGIRDIGVTGVQTCALPIWSRICMPRPWSLSGEGCTNCGTASAASSWTSISSRPPKIGRASCRERVQISVVAASLKKNLYCLHFHYLHHRHHHHTRYPHSLP